jgi:ssRNA-specific RNase YbeY (16S rRNA maturation enzyme)
MVGKKDAIAHYQREADRAIQDKILETLEQIDKTQEHLKELGLVQKKQIENLNDQTRTITAAMDVLSRAIQSMEERIKWLEENAHA